MGRTPKASARGVYRYQLLIDQIGDEVGKPHRGWRAAVARRLGVDASLITKVLDDDSGYILGEEALGRACENLGLRSEFFSVGSPRKLPHYTTFLEPDRQRLPARRSGPEPLWDDLLPRAPKLERALADHSADAKEVHALALDILAVPAVQAAMRIAELNPSKANERRIFAEAPKLVGALKQERAAMLSTRRRVRQRQRRRALGVTTGRAAG